MLKGKALRKDMELSLIENPTLTTGATRQARGLRGLAAVQQQPGRRRRRAGGHWRQHGPDRRHAAHLRRIALARWRAPGLPVRRQPDHADAAPDDQAERRAAFTGGGTRFVQIADKKLESTFDFYEHDFGTSKWSPNRVMSRTREGYLVDPEMVALAVLRDMETTELARIGSARNYMVETEYTLECREERAHACLRDLQ